MKFGSPQMLWMLLILVGPLIAFLCWAWRVRQRLITQFISSRLLNQLKVGVSPTRQKVRLSLMVAAVMFIVLALARPQWGMSQEEARQRGLDIIVAIDTSKSMLAEDVQPNRLARAKLAALDLLRRARTDRLGLVAFAGSAFLECPLTLDDGAFASSVNALDTKTISDGGTAIGDAIDAADRAFKNESDDHKVLVLFTDGEDHDSDAVAAARKAAKDGMVIFTIGIGSPEGELLRITDEHGRMDYIRDEQGQPVKSKLDEKLLQQIAAATKGFYLPLRGAKTMDTLYEKGIEPLPKSEKSSRIFQYYQDRFYWPLSIAILILIFEMFFPDRQRRRKKTPTSPSTVVAAETAAIMLLLLLPAGARASSGSALREYDEGKFEDALKDYNKLLERKQDDPRLHFNTGAAAYQSKQLEQATNEFNAALMSPDLKLQEHAYYNLGNTLYRMGQQESDAEKKQAAWENALTNYQSAEKLNPQDGDAKFNQQFVKQQLQELKKQQQQQKQQQKNSDKNKDQKQNKDQKDQQNQSQNQQDKQDQKDQKDQQKNDQQNKGQTGQDSKTDQVKEKSDEQKKQEEQEAKERQQQQAEQKKPEDQKSTPGQTGEQKDKNDEDAKRDAEMMAAGQMTPTQAKQLLDAQKDKERVFQLAPPNKNQSRNPHYKDW